MIRYMTIFCLVFAWLKVTELTFFCSGKNAAYNSIVIKKKKIMYCCNNLILIIFVIYSNEKFEMIGYCNEVIIVIILYKLLQSISTIY